MGEEIHPIVLCQAALEALRQSVLNLAEASANLRLLTAAVVPDHHQAFMDEFAALDAIAETMHRALEDFADACKPGQPGVSVQGYPFGVIK